MPSVLAIAVTPLAAGATLIMPALLLARSPSRTPRRLARIKAVMIGVAAIGLIGFARGVGAPA